MLTFRGKLVYCRPDTHLAFFRTQHSTHNIRFRYSGNVTALQVSCKMIMMINSMAVLRSYWLRHSVRRVVCSWPCGLHGMVTPVVVRCLTRYRCCPATVCVHNFHLRRSLSCLVCSNTSTNTCCSLLHHDDFKEPLDHHLQNCSRR
jgi:hypothetical protein